MVNLISNLCKVYFVGNSNNLLDINTTGIAEKTEVTATILEKIREDFVLKNFS